MNLYVRKSYGLDFSRVKNASHFIDFPTCFKFSHIIIAGNILSLIKILTLENVVRCSGITDKFHIRS